MTSIRTAPPSAQSLLGDEVCEALQYNPDADTQSKGKRSKTDGTSSSTSIDWTRLIKYAVEADVVKDVVDSNGDTSRYSPQQLYPITIIPPDQRWIIAFMHDQHIINLASYKALGYWDDCVVVDGLLRRFRDQLDDPNMRLNDADVLQTFADVMYLGYKFPADHALLGVITELTEHMRNKLVHLAHKGDPHQQLAASTYSRTLLDEDDDGTALQEALHARKRAADDTH